MEIKKAIITAAGKDQRQLPLQTLVDRDGIAKSALRILIDEVVQAGIGDICVVIAPGDESAYRAAVQPQPARLRFVEQHQPRGYGHAVACARDFVDSEPFLLLVSDHLYVSGEQRNCAGQLLALARAEQSAVSAVQATHESKLPYYGTVGGRLAGTRPGLYQVESVVEKPTPTEAEQRLLVPGLRAAHYLCFFGMHVLTPALMELLTAQLEASPEAAVHLSVALAALAQRERYLAAELAGRRYDIGSKYGLLTTQLALALAGVDREEVLVGLVELLAQRAI